MVGITFAGRTTTYAQCVTTEDGYIVTTLGTVSLPVAPDPAVLVQPELTSLLTSLFTHILELLPVQDSQIAIAIPYELIHLALIEIDPLLDQEERQEFLEWEFSQRLSGKEHNLTPRFYPLTGGDDSTVLSVGIPSGLLPACREASEAVSTSLEAVEIDILTPLADIQAEEDTFLIKFGGNVISGALFAHDRLIAATLMDQATDSAGTPFLKGCGGLEDRKRCENALRAVTQDESPESQCYLFGTDIPDNLSTKPEVSYLSPFPWIGKLNRGTILRDWHNPWIFGTVSGLLHHLASEVHQ